MEVLEDLDEKKSNKHMHYTHGFEELNAHSRPGDPKSIATKKNAIKRVATSIVDLEKRFVIFVP